MGTVLIAAPKAEDREILRRAIEPSGFIIYETDRVEDVAARAKATRPHAIVWDADWPRRDLERMRGELASDPAMAAAPILLWGGIEQREADAESDFLAGPSAEWLERDAPPETIRAKTRRLVEFGQFVTTALLNERLAQLGRLLAGVIHEIRGPLSLIKTNADLLRIEAGDQSPFSPRIEPIVRNTQLLQVRLEHLMSTVRGGAGQRSPVDPGDIAKEAFDLFRSGVNIQARAKLTCDFAANAPFIQADPGQLLQVLLNLLINAHEAVPADREPQDNRISLRVRSESREGREGVVFEVRNNGEPIPDEHLARLFEPFFTTKPGGSGFGLYLSSTIVRDHGGRIFAANLEEGEGVQFTVWAPVS